MPHVIVLGAGVVGITTAWYLRQAGYDVTVYDKHSGPGEETSFANAGQISPGYASPWAAPGVPLKALKWLFEEHAPLAIRLTTDIHQYKWMAQMVGNCTQKRYAINKERMVRLAEYSRDCLNELRNSTHLNYEERCLGTTQLFRTQKQVDAAQRDIAVLQQAGVAYEMLDRSGVALVEPGMSFNNDVIGGLRLPNDQTGDCYVFCQQLEQLAKNNGVEFHYGSHIELFKQYNNEILGVCINGVFEKADQYVVALGSYSPDLVRRLGLPIPVYPLKGYSLTVPIVEPDSAPTSTVLDETYKIAVTRFNERIRVGGMAELSGYNYELNPKRRATLEKVVTDLYPHGGNIEQATFWTGLRPATPDGTPIVGATPIKNLYINTGHGTLGWTMACGSGQLIADLIAKKQPAIDPNGLNIYRYIG